ncbi:MAG: hypothetical protein P1U34_03805 [Coxiellaceae bacterium]|nr:hypothetical protein [Coxiellaceae bacterium]
MRHFILPTLIGVVASQPLLASHLSTDFLQPIKNKHSYTTSTNTVKIPLILTRTETWSLNNAPTLYAKVKGVTFYYQTSQINGRCSGVGQTFDLNDEQYVDTGIALNGSRGDLPALNLFAAGFTHAANQLGYTIPSNGIACAKLFIAFQAGSTANTNRINTKFKPLTFEYTNIVSPGNNVITNGAASNNRYTLEQTPYFTLQKPSLTPNTVDTGRLSSEHPSVQLTNIGLDEAHLILPFNLAERGITTDCTTPLGINSHCQFTYNGRSSRGDGVITAASINYAAKAIYPFHIAKTGHAKCWGINDFGQLGDGTTDNRHEATTVAGLTNVLQLASGKQHACALKNSGDIYCWGDNTFGQLGNGSTISSPIPVKVSAISHAVSISAGRYHTCALLNSGEMKCWGENSFGQLGNNQRDQQTTAVTVSGLTSGVHAIAVGNNYSCALLQTGSAKCWGENSHGQLGNGNIKDQLVPAAVSDLGNDTTYAVSIAAGDNHSCALLNDGTMKCWGENDYGQLGIGNNDSFKITPQTVNGGRNFSVAALEAGGKHTCVITQAGGMMCWGKNSDGQLGIGDFEPMKNTPQPVTGLRYGVVGISASARSTCALKSGGKVLCWGNNEFGQLGDGSTTFRDTPIAVENLKNNAFDLASNNGEGKFNCAIE